MAIKDNISVSKIAIRKIATSVMKHKQYQLNNDTVAQTEVMNKLGSTKSCCFTAL
jgi:hypothetical protein